MHTKTQEFKEHCQRQVQLDQTHPVRELDMKVNVPTSSGKGNAIFFDRLKRWEYFDRAVEIFDEDLNRPIQETKSNFNRHLYDALIDQLLDWLEMPRANSSREWEWRELYRFGREASSHYYSEGRFQKMLAHWPVFDFRQRRIIVSVLTGFFQLQRSNFPSNFPSPLLSNGESDQWIRIFPPQWAWKSLDILRQVGLLPMGSRRGYRVFTRFMEGEFLPRLMPDTLHRWQAECWQNSISFARYPDDPTAPYLCNHVSASFTGRFNMIGIEGVCDTVPDCDRCEMRSDCRWNHASISDQPGATEILTLAKLGKVESLPTEMLYQGLFQLSEEEMKHNRSKLAGTSMRQLSAMTNQELTAMFGSRNSILEKLRITFELGKRFNEERLNVGGTFSSPWDIFSHFRMRLRDLKQEQLIVVLLDNQKRYLNDLVITQGTLNTSPVHPREVYNAAIRESAAYLVIVHNHPSGDPKPSKDDIEVTRQLTEVGLLVGIPILDHVIIADDRYTSMLEEGLLTT